MEIYVMIFPARPFLLRLAVLAAGMLVPLWFILALKWPISTDFLFYAAMLKSFSAQFWAGEWYPRWLMESNGGFGSPVFLFYGGPVPFYLMSFFEWLSSVDPHGFGRLILGMALAVFISGITCYRWLAGQMDQASAEKGALLYAGFPLLFLVIYASFGLALMWAIALFPLVLQAAAGLSQRGWRGIPFFGGAFGLLFLTHPASALVFSGVAWCYATAFSPPGRRWQHGVLAGTAMFLGVGLAAIYIFPAIANKPFMTTDHFLSGRFWYGNNFFDMHSLWGIFAILLPLLGLYTELPAAMRRGLSFAARFWIAMIVWLFFMAAPLSRPLWDAVPLLQYLVYPFRFFYAMLPGAVFLAVVWLPYARSKLIYKAFFILGGALAIAYCADTFFYKSPDPAQKIIEGTYIPFQEYRTRWMKEAGIESVLKLPEYYEKFNDPDLIKGNGHISNFMQSPRGIRFEADILSKEAVIVFKRFYFPGWVASDGSSIMPERGLLAITVPKGKHDITLNIPYFAGEKPGMWFSAVSILFLLGLAICGKYPWRQAKK